MYFTPSVVGGAGWRMAVLVFGPVGIDPAGTAGNLKRNAGKAAVGAVIVDGELNGVIPALRPWMHPIFARDADSKRKPLDKCL
jgi:hypothetical protein